MEQNHVFVLYINDLVCSNQRIRLEQMEQNLGTRPMLAHRELASHQELASSRTGFSQNWHLLELASSN
jgi:hypothetical protein